MYFLPGPEVIFVNLISFALAELKEQHTEQLSAAALDTDVAKSELEAAHASELQQYKDKLEELQQEHQVSIS